jgi:hypothetical protein
VGWLPWPRTAFGHLVNFNLLTNSSFKGVEHQARSHPLKSPSCLWVHLFIPALFPRTSANRVWTPVSPGLRMALMAMLFAALGVTVAAVYDRPQYLAVNFDYDPGVPRTFTQESISTMLAALNNTRGGDRRQLAFSFDFWTLYDANVSVMLESLDALLALALNNDLPLSLSIDATQWWQFRPDLWNWYNSSAPGYDAANVANVEWAGPTVADATSISWRNWGYVRRVPGPAYAG